LGFKTFSFGLEAFALGFTSFDFGLKAFGFGSKEFNFGLEALGFWLEAFGINTTITFEEGAYGCSKDHFGITSNDIA